MENLQLESRVTELVNALNKAKKKVATMESCTGGGLANQITNVSGASEVLEFGTVTYSNDFKVKMGVSGDVISAYTVYSVQTANEMSQSIAEFASADYGVGITGQLRRSDPNNPTTDDDLVYISVFSRADNAFTTKTIRVFEERRQENKAVAILNAVELLLSVLAGESE